MLEDEEELGVLDADEVELTLLDEEDEELTLLELDEDELGLLELTEEELGLLELTEVEPETLETDEELEPDETELEVPDSVSELLLSEDDTISELISSDELSELLTVLLDDTPLELLLESPLLLLPCLTQPIIEKSKITTKPREILFIRLFNMYNPPTKKYIKSSDILSHNQ